MNNQETRDKNQIITKNQNSIIKGLLVIGSCLYLVSCILVIPVKASQIIDPNDVGVGARPLGMGKAFTAVSGSPSSMFINPAGISDINRLSITSMSGNLMSEVPYAMAGVCLPFAGGTVGIGYVGLNIGGINEMTLVGITPEATGNQGSFNDSSLNISYAAKLQNIPYLNKISNNYLKDADFGFTIKNISQKFSNIASADAGSGSGFALDLGTVIKPDQDTKIGIALKNILSTNILSDAIPASANLGISKYFTKYNLLTDLDLEFSRAAVFHLGVEWDQLKYLVLRAGIDQKPSAGSTVSNLTAGLGLNFKNFTFDYAYHTYAGLAEFTSHYFSIGICLDAPKKAASIQLKPIEVKPIPIAQPKPKELKPLMPSLKNTIPKKKAKKAPVKKANG